MQEHLRRLREMKRHLGRAGNIGNAGGTGILPVMARSSIHDGRDARPTSCTRVIGSSILPVMALACVTAACPDVPREGHLVIEGGLDREGVEETNLAAVDVTFDSDNARGEWWSCELRLTAESCVGDHHVNVWVAMPGSMTFDLLGQPTCRRWDGHPARHGAR